MSDDDSDSEAQGIDALRLLKQGSVGPNVPAEALAGPPSSQTASVPLVPLLPSQKRSRSLSQDLHDQAKPSTSQRVQAGSAASHRPVTQNRGSQGRDIRHHSSAPERCFSLAKELRNSKSAPDLTLPALAAIRGLQNGTLQVDRHTRLKIAAAAKRVLEARELKRRSSVERESPSVYPYPPPDPMSPRVSRPQQSWESSKPGSASTTPPSPSEGWKSEGREKSFDGGTPPRETPGSLSTAAAIPKGQSPSGSTQGNFHRPALNTVSQGGALLSTSHRPFTVTTGLPRFSIATRGQSDADVALPIMPTTPLGNRADDFTPPKLKESKVLGADDIFKPQPDRP